MGRASSGLRGCRNKPGIAAAREFTEWLTIRDQEQSMRDDVKRIRKHPLVPKKHPTDFPERRFVANI